MFFVLIKICIFANDGNTEDSKDVDLVAQDRPLQGVWRAISE